MLIRKRIIPVLATLVLVSMALALFVDIPAVLAHPSGEVSVAADNVLQLGDEEEVVVTFRNTADNVADVADTMQYITLAAANLNPSRTLIALEASWAIYEPGETDPRVNSTVQGTVDEDAVYAPYSTVDTVYLYTWELGEPDEGVDSYTDSGDFEEQFRVLRPGETLRLTVTVQCQDVVGDSRLWFFFRATEFEPETGDIPLTDIDDIPLAERMNLYYQDEAAARPVGWWPLHNSYNPYDQAMNTGHSFVPVGRSPTYSWERDPTIRAFAKADKLVHQKPRETQPNPCIEITKTGPAEAMIGETITYMFTVSNCGNVGLTGVTVDDPLLGLEDYSIGDLAVGDSYTFSANYTIPEDPPDPLVNTATASGWYNGQEETSDDVHSVVIAPESDPCIEITKTGPDEAMIGETITYLFTVSNCGNVGLTDVTVEDDLLGLEDYSIGDLAVGDSHTFSATYTIPEGAPDPLVNTATASGWYNGQEETDDDVHSVVIAPESDPCIEITKTGPAEAMIGETITYLFTVSNCGNVGLTDVTVEDDLLGLEDYSIGDLAVGDSYTFSATYTIPEGAPDPLVNTATASGSHGDVQKSAQASSSLAVGPSYSFHICGVKFHDLDRDGNYDVEIEPGIDGVTITLFGPDKVTPAEEFYPEITYPDPEENPLLSGENELRGSYCFNIENLQPGEEYTFYLRKELRAGTVATTPTLVGPITLVADEEGNRESLNNHFGNAKILPTVGWVGSPPSRLALVAPWIALAAVVAGALVFVRRRHAQS